MKRTNHSRRDRKKFLNMLAANWQQLLFMFLFILGMAWGCTAVKDSSGTLNSIFQSILTGFTASRIEHSFFATLFNSFIPSLAIVLVIFLAGLSPAGVPVVGAVPVFRGFGLGIISGYLYQTQGLKGIAYCLLTIYPHSILSVTALILCSLEAWRMSFHFISLFRADYGQINFSSELKLYTARFSVFLGIIMFSCIMDAFLSKVFSGFFVF